jgi:pimeloyl-ACP methyl ester carboxylesterase
MTVTHHQGSSIPIPGTTARFLSPTSDDGPAAGELRYLTGGDGPPLVLLHTVRTQAEHFRELIAMVSHRHTVYALDLPGMGYSEIVPGASYDEPAMRAGVERLITGVDLRNVTLLGESMGATLALTVAADLPDRVRHVVAVNPYDYRGGITRSSVLARTIITGVTAPGVGPHLAGVEPKPIMRAILRGGLVQRDARRDDYLSELLAVGRRPGYATVARAVYRNLDSMITARQQYGAVTAPVHLVYGERDWSRQSDRDANRRALPDATHVDLEGTGHFVALERPDALAAIVRSLT